MFSFKKFIATAALAFAATTAPANAYQEGGRQLMNALEDAGVEVTVGGVALASLTLTVSLYLLRTGFISALM